MFLWLSLFKEANPLWGELAHSHGSGYPLKSCSSAALFSVLPDNANIGIYQLTQFKLHSCIYRLRNEIIHDAATNTNNELITSNLRYYLTFILNELITFFSNAPNKEISIEDFFILNELKLGN